VVGDGDGVAADLLSDLGQKAIAHLPRRLFDGEPLTFGVSRYVARLDGAGQAPLSS